MGSSPEDHTSADEVGKLSVAPFVGRSPRISQADVFRAADELLVEGHRPTIDRVRMRLGRGSPNTINDHLDVWWTKLGSRLRDLPGREFPQLPERIAHVLQQLWNEALEGAREALTGVLAEREAALEQREQGLENWQAKLAERERVTAAHSAALEEGVTLAREQLAAANRASAALEASLQERDADCGRLRDRVQTLEVSCAELRGQLEAAAVAYQSERDKLQAYHEASQRRWMTEVDRAREGAKEAAKEHDRTTKELRKEIRTLSNERDQLRGGLLEARGELKTAAAIRAQLEERLRAASSAQESPRGRKFRPRGQAKPKRRVR
jgi:hypothetical protein